MGYGTMKFALGVIAGAVAGVSIYKHRHHLNRMMHTISKDLTEIKDEAVRSAGRVKDVAADKAEDLKRQAAQG